MYLTVSRDQGHDPLSSEATVVVRIDDLNDNAPTVTVRTLHGSTSTELPESSAVGSFVAHVSVVDQDSAASGHVNCSVNHPSVFTLQQNLTLTLTIEGGRDLDAGHRGQPSSQNDSMMLRRIFSRSERKEVM